MRIHRIWPFLALAILANGCSESDPGAGPDPIPDGPPQITSFFVTDADVVHGDWTEVRWRISGSTAASISPDLGPISAPANGAQSVRPARPVTYTLTASNAHGSVSATATIAVTYRAGVYVDFVDGDDANGGGSPDDAVSSLQVALDRTTGGGTIYLSAGVYTTNIVIDGPGRSIYGGLDPATFFEEEGYITVLQPTSGAAIWLMNSLGASSYFKNLRIDTRMGTQALRVDNSRMVAEDCIFDGRASTTGNPVRITGGSDVTLRRCQVMASSGPPITPPIPETQGVLVEGTSALTLSHCFVYGGVAFQKATGVDVNTTGPVALSYNTISAHLTGGVGAAEAAAIRMRMGNPAIGGNFLFTQGSGERHALIEEAADADPSRFEGNLLVAAGFPPYDNYSSDGVDPTNETDLNSYWLINNIVGGTVRENVLKDGLPVTQMLVNYGLGNFHLVEKLPAGGLNPAINNGAVLNVDVYGFQLEDIDGQRRPSSWSAMDRGADEFID